MPVTQQVHRVAAPLRQQVVELLRIAIVAGEFQPGERLVEQPLCDRFGVSRTVVREALRQMEAEGLVTMVANRGPVVATLGFEDVRAIYEVRAALEGLAGALFAKHASAAECADLIRAVDRVAEAYGKSELELWLEAKDAFYRVLFTGAHNDIAGDMIAGLHARVQLLRGLSLSSPGRAAQSLQELREIVDAAAVRRDPAIARSACELHIERAATVALAAMT